MARRTVYNCDRCKREYESDESGQVGVMVGATGESYYDLCPSCMNEINSWLEGPLLTPPGYVEKCSHNIPCAGPCNQPHLVPYRG